MTNMTDPMESNPTETNPPPGSTIESLLPGAYFHDAWAIRAAQPDLDALGQFLRIAGMTPLWIERLMSIRNRMVSVLGLKNLGGLSQIDASKKAADYQAGDRVGIFTLISLTPNEVLLGDRDKHLDVVISIHKRMENDGDDAVLTLTTVVHVHNWLGRLYMLPVTPAHRVIARTMVSAAGNIDA